MTFRVSFLINTPKSELNKITAKLAEIGATNVLVAEAATRSLRHMNPSQESAFSEKPKCEATFSNIQSVKRPDLMPTAKAKVTDFCDHMDSNEAERRRNIVRRCLDDFNVVKVMDLSDSKLPAFIRRIDQEYNLINLRESA